MIDPRSRQVFRLIWNDGRLSRSEIHVRTGITPNGVGTTAEAMLRDGLLRECAVNTVGVGRPRVPLEIDPSRRHIIGLALIRGRVEIARLALSGDVIDRVVGPSEEDPSRLVMEAARLLRKYRDKRTIGIGLSVTGFVDPKQKLLLLNNPVSGRYEYDLRPITDAALALPLVLENDMHALAARWLLTHRAEQDQDVVLAFIEDGQMGAAVLINGRPNRGCATGANDLGHMRFFIDTEPCFCGHVGCLERIISTYHLHRLDSELGLITLKNKATLSERVANYSGTANDDPSLERLIKYLAGGLANVVNFVRPHRLVIVSSFMRNSAFAERLKQATASQILSRLVTRVKLDRWDEPASAGAETAAWLGMAELLCGGWDDSSSHQQRELMLS